MKFLLLIQVILIFVGGVAFAQTALEKSIVEKLIMINVLKTEELFQDVDVLGRTPKLSDGVISGENGLRGDPWSYQTTVSIQPGNSGGPLLNMKGEVVGVVTAMVGIRDNLQGEMCVLENTSIVKKIECVKDLLVLLPEPKSVINSLPINYDSLETLADRMQDSVLIVEAR